MSKIFKALFPTFTVCFLFGFLLIFPKEASNAAKDGLEMCLKSIIPSLFPFFVLSSLLIGLGFAKKSAKFFEKLMQPLFGLSGNCAPALILGLIGGYPSGAKTAKSLYDSGLCTKEECERLLGFCSNSGPAFIFGIVASQVFKIPALGFPLYVIHIISAILSGILLKSKGNSSKTHTPAPSVSQSFASVFTTSVSSSFSSVLNICGFIIFFCCFKKALELCGFFSFLSSLLCSFFPRLNTQFCESLLTSLLELSSGLLSMPSEVSLLSLSAASFMLAQSGLSVHFQVMSVIDGSGIRLKYYICGKLLQPMIAAALTALFFGFFSETPVFSSSFSISVPLYMLFIIYALICLPIIILLLKNTGKRQHNSV